MDLLRDLLQVSDGLDLAVNHLSGAADSPGIRQGLEGVKEMLDKFFTQNDVKMIEAMGEAFDPNVHKALGMIQSSTTVPNVVVRVEKKGYLYHDRLLRPAQVLVASDWASH